MKTPIQQAPAAGKTDTRQPFLQRKPSNTGAAERPFISPQNSPVIQPKLTVNKPGDAYEREADAMAEQVMRMPITNPAPPMISRMRAGAPVQRKCDACAAEEAEKEPDIQRKAENADPTHASEAVTQRLIQRKGRGDALPAGVHEQMGQAFQADFSDVRVHTDREAAQMSSDLNAQAFTYGNDIYFNSGKYAPETVGGRGLLGHELTHTVQQGGDTIKRFTECEHKHIVDDAYRMAGLSIDVELVPGFWVTVGDITAMTGDHFESRAQILKFLNNSAQTGKESIEEVLYVLCKEINCDEERDVCKGKSFSKEAKDNADERYYKLASKNIVHFLYPQKGDDALPLSSVAQSQLPDLSSPDSLPDKGAVGGYRYYHMMALEAARVAGENNEGIETAMAIDASGYHFLTDSFSSGHVMTPRSTIKDYWQSKVPMFLTNFKGYIANKVADESIRLLQSAGVGNGLPLRNVLYEVLLEKVSALIESKGRLEFGDVISGALHDYYNEYGIIAKINGKEVLLYGDSKLDFIRFPIPYMIQFSDSRYFASVAVGSSHDELLEAYTLGKGKKTIDEVLETIKKDGVYAAERLLPKSTGEVYDENANLVDPIKWEFNSVDELLADSQFQEAFGLFAHKKAGEFKKAVSELKIDLPKFIPPTNTIWMKPLIAYIIKRAFDSEIIEPLNSTPIQVLEAVINWTPDTGGGWFGHDEDDKAREYVADSEKVESTLGFLTGLDSLTLKQRVRLINQMIKGWTWVGEPDQEAVVKIFKHTSPKDRLELYRRIEGHPWTGELIDTACYNPFNSDDVLHDALDGKEYREVENLINDRVVLEKPVDVTGCAQRFPAPASYWNDASDLSKLAEEIKNLIASPNPIAGSNRAYEAFPILEGLDTPKLNEVLDYLDIKELEQLQVEASGSTVSQCVIYTINTVLSTKTQTATE